MDNQWLSTAPLAAFLVGHVVLAVLVSCHAVLHKEDVRSAFGWIGLAVSSQIIGALAGSENNYHRALLLLPGFSVLMVLVNLVLRPVLNRKVVSDQIGV